MKKVTSKPIASSKESQPEAGVEVDRSREILQAMDKEPRDQVTCVRVFDDFYRCNWWSPRISTGPAQSIFHGLEVSTYRVRKSHFVRAAIRDGQLVVEDATPAKPE
jgi:hypothetical protein